MCNTLCARKRLTSSSRRIDMNYSLDENYILRGCVFLENLCNRESSSTRLTIFVIRRFEFRVTSTKRGLFVFIYNIVVFNWEVFFFFLIKEKVRKLQSTLYGFIKKKIYILSKLNYQKLKLHSMIIGKYLYIFFIFCFYI